MQTIPIETVNSIWQRVAEFDEQQSRALAERAQREQPYMMVYLLAMDERLFDEDERGRLMELGAFIYAIMSEGRSLRCVTARDLEKRERANIRFIEEMEKGSEMQFTDGALNLFASYNQMPLLGAVIESVMADYEDAPQLVPEWIGEAMLYLKTVIDCLDHNWER